MQGMVFLDITGMMDSGISLRCVATCKRASEPPSISTAPRMASTVVAIDLSDTFRVPGLRIMHASRPRAKPTAARLELVAMFLMSVQSPK